MLASVSVRSVTIFAVASPYAWDVLESLTRAGITPDAVDNLGGADPRLPLLALDDAPRGPFVIGLSAAHTRAMAAASAAALGFDEPVAVIDPTAVVAGTAEVAHGAYINALAVVASHASVGCHANVNRSASIGHDARLGFASSVGPGAVLAGGVVVETEAFIGAGATILPGVTIGRGAVVGAGAVVVADVGPGEIVTGNPARTQRREAIDGEEAACPHSSRH
jgi:sugar O-acyltransferase (sialic acid O-acetyltransferase NeuD family)